MKWKKFKQVAVIRRSLPFEVCSVCFVPLNCQTNAIQNENEKWPGDLQIHMRIFWGLQLKPAMPVLPVIGCVSFEIYSTVVSFPRLLCLKMIFLNTFYSRHQ